MSELLGFDYAYFSGKELWQIGLFTVAIGLPFLAVSANATTDHVEEAKQAGADDHVAKPIVREVLFDAIARYAKPSAKRASAGDDFDFDLDDLDIAV